MSKANFKIRGHRPYFSESKLYSCIYESYMLSMKIFAVKHIFLYLPKITTWMYNPVSYSAMS